MKRFEPKAVATHGLIGFHLQVGLRTSIWKLETVGAAGQWDQDRLDDLASMVAFLTPYDNPKMKPLPLWYAEILVIMSREVLLTYFRSTLGMIKDRAVDRAWLEGIETMNEGELDRNPAVELRDSVRVSVFATLACDLFHLVTATASTSSMYSSRASFPTCTKVAAGGALPT